MIIFRYYWNTSYEIVYLTNHGIEIYSVLHERKTVKYIRCLSHPITWFAYCVRSYLLVSKIIKDFMAHSYRVNVRKQDIGIPEPFTYQTF